MTKRNRSGGASEGSDQVPGGQDHSEGQREGSTFGDVCLSEMCVITSGILGINLKSHHKECNYSYNFAIKIILN